MSKSIEQGTGLSSISTGRNQKVSMQDSPPCNSVKQVSGVKTALILGATGGFGSALTKQMASVGWQIRAVSRNPEVVHEARQHDMEVSTASKSEGRIEWFLGNLDEPSSLTAAAANVDVIVHSVNVPYPKWDPLMVNYTRTIIELARDNDAHLLFVGNVYNAGIPSDGLISGDSVDAPVNEKGELRARLEGMLREAAGDGLRTTIMRFGDFLGLE